MQYPAPFHTRKHESARSLLRRHGSDISNFLFSPMMVIDGIAFYDRETSRGEVGRWAVGGIFVDLLLGKDLSPRFASWQ
jgi:hypothetical protein